MPRYREFVLILSLLGVVLAQNYTTKALIQAYHMKKEEKDRLVAYMNDILKRNRIEVTEFDIIALRQLGIEVKIREEA